MWDAGAERTPRLAWTTLTPKHHHTKIETYYPQTTTTYLCFSLFSLSFICIGVQPTWVPGGLEGTTHSCEPPHVGVGNWTPSSRKIGALNCHAIPPAFNFLGNTSKYMERVYLTVLSFVQAQSDIKMVSSLLFVWDLWRTVLIFPNPQAYCI